MGATSSTEQEVGNMTDQQARELIEVLSDISETLTKVERNQRLHTKVVLGSRVLSVPFSQAKDLTREDISAFGGKVQV